MAHRAEDALQGGAGRLVDGCRKRVGSLQQRPVFLARDLDNTEVMVMYLTRFRGLICQPGGFGLLITRALGRFHNRAQIQICRSQNPPLAHYRKKTEDRVGYPQSQV